MSTTSMLSTPGVTEPAGGGSPALSLIGEFHLKSIPLLGLSFCTLSEAITAVQHRKLAADYAIEEKSAAHP